MIIQSPSFVLSCLISTILAVQAARPKIIRSDKKIVNPQKASLLFFGVIARYTQPAYLDIMEKLLDSRKEIYEHMTIDLYNQGLILARKYNLLGYAYHVFMYGFIFSVVSFLIFLAMG